MERIRLTGSIVAAAVVSFAITLSLPGVLFADTPAHAGQILLISDEISGNSVDVDRPSGGDAVADAGNGNNGHGNNLDGVDSSNPSQGGGGPNGMDDPSGGVDDEAGGGGAAPSNVNGGGNGKGKGK